MELASTVYTIDQLHKAEIDWSLPQVALAGRSNVGKSSCLNCLGNRKNLARTSATPGKTQSVNFFRIRFPGEDAAFHLVDLPGYGYARRSKSERDKWAALMEAYLSGARRPRTVVILVDGRHPPQQLDVDLVDYCRAAGLDWLLVCTKADKCSQKDKTARLHEWREVAPDMLLQDRTGPLFFSSVTRQGRDALWRKLREAAGVPESVPAAMPEPAPGTAHQSS
ncbi:putative ribosome biogenesis GTP-binding protein YsxC [Megalodesulfovibrio gigas DSM 1382 = ATCC 19364]|uniref:Probable GTP-binding protein EngB n=1 Tax=Megalodesulfovibrio gigas (strain ATCC 19364 / DSM 1382 / NCIMB 9332 / VKM B-1759) TaxID=1121448 RepID=T2G722_MEGG1|nr:putative ribosome biogenesis GTP-binding protein YsxC [Megalodesulfovibrio gigas DSM 1382 = ATCC 19364]